jgi:hypothetical protein
MTSLPVALTILWILNLQPSGPRLGTALTHEGRLTDGVSAAGGIYYLEPTIYDAGGGRSVVARPISNSPVGVANDLFTVNAGLR